MTAQVDGIAWSATDPVRATLAPSGGLYISGMQNLSGGNWTISSISIGIPLFDGAGVYPLGASDSLTAGAGFTEMRCTSNCSDFALVQTTYSTYSTTPTATGVVTILAFNRSTQTVSGTFEFTAQDTAGNRNHTIHYGVFSAELGVP